MNRTLSLFFVIALLLSACATPTAAPAPTKAPEPTAVAQPLSATASGTVRVTGKFTYSNNIITEYYVEHFVALIDLTGFVKRDREWEVPVKSQVLGFLQLDEKAQKGEYQLSLPIRPEGSFDDVDNNGKPDKGVQIFAVDYNVNLTGGPFLEGDDRYRGWPSYLASVKVDTENKQEIIGGKLIVWAADDKQQFPTGFGNDGLLFTADDPVASIPAGYTVIDLDKKPFGIIRDSEPSLELYEPKDAEIKDYSKMTYSDAFDALHKKASVEWSFNDIPNKKVDWKALYDRIAPKVAEAQKNKDGKAFYLALKEYANSIPDGHVGVGGGAFANEVLRARIDNGYGFAIRELDNGKVIVTYVTTDSPADKAGIKVGAEVTEFNGLPIKDAISKADASLAGPFSQEPYKRYQQTRYLLRDKLGAEATVKFVNANGQPQTAKVTAVAERNSYSVTSIFRGFDSNALPVESKILDSGAGYIKINTNSDDLNLIIRLFERALKVFTANGVTGVVIDMRQNSGGAPLGLAGFFYDKEILLGQLQYYSEKTGKFENEGLRQKILPNVNQYKFEKLVLMVSFACFSACEIESYGFSKVPGAIVVSANSSAGVEAEVARGQFRLPEGLSMQISTGRFLNPDGSIFLEGVGVQPTLKVAVDEKFALSSEDVVLKTAEAAALGKTIGGGASGSGPTFASAADSRKALGTIKTLEDVAKEKYKDNELSQAGKTYTYTIGATSAQSLMWITGWCATTQAILDDNNKNTTYTFSMNGKPLDITQFAVLEGKQGTQFCKLYMASISNWSKGDTKLETKVTFANKINDGTADYPAGTHLYVYTVTAP